MSKVKQWFIFAKVYHDGRIEVEEPFYVDSLLDQDWGKALKHRNVGKFVAIRYYTGTKYTRFRSLFVFRNGVRLKTSQDWDDAIYLDYPEVDACEILISHFHKLMEGID